MVLEEIKSDILSGQTFMVMQKNMSYTEYNSYEKSKHLYNSFWSSVKEYYNLDKKEIRKLINLF